MKLDVKEDAIQFRGISCQSGVVISDTGELNRVLFSPFGDGMNLPGPVLPQHRREDIGLHHLEYRNTQEQRRLRVAAIRKILIGGIGTIVCLGIVAIPTAFLIVPAVVEIIHDHHVGYSCWKALACGIAFTLLFLWCAIMGIGQVIEAFRNYRSS